MDVGGGKEESKPKCGTMKEVTRQPNSNVKVINKINLVSISLLLISKKSNFKDTSMVAKDPNNDNLHAEASSQIVFPVIKLR